MLYFWIVQFQPTVSFLTSLIEIEQSKMDNVTLIQLMKQFIPVHLVFDPGGKFSVPFCRSVCQQCLTDLRFPTEKARLISSGVGCSNFLSTFSFSSLILYPHLISIYLLSHSYIFLLLVSFIQLQNYINGGNDLGMQKVIFIFIFFNKKKKVLKRKKQNKKPRKYSVKPNHSAKNKIGKEKKEHQHIWRLRSKLSKI